LRSVARVSAILVVTLFLSSTGACQNKNLPYIPMDWFNGPELHAKHWKVQIGPPILLFNQRYALGSSAEFPLTSSKNSPNIDLHLVVRVADQQGRWFEGSDYTRINPKPSTDKGRSAVWRTDFYVRSGIYQVALLVYDAITQQHYLWKKTVTVDRASLLPDLDRNMPAVEFADPGGIHPPFGEYLPVRNPKPLRVDVVLNLTDEVQLNMQPGAYGRWRHVSVESALMGAISVLSQLKPAQGCVRVSAIDIVHLEVARDRAFADLRTDWQKIREALHKNRDQSTVDVHTLEGRTKAREFFRHFLETVMSDESGCGLKTPISDRALIVVSDSLMFPGSSDNEPVSPMVQHGSQIYHLKIALRGMLSYDQVGKMMAQLHPHTFTIGDPRDLRKSIAEIVRDLEQPTEKPATSR
jgi:hypothetical protein